MPTVQERLGHLEGRVNEHAHMFGLFEKRFDGLDQRIDRLEQHVDRFEQRVDARFDAADRRFDAIDRRFADLDKKLSGQFTLMMSMLVTVIVGFVGSVIAILVT